MRRSNGTGAASVDYATSNGTASSGSDYTANAGTLAFLDSVLSRTFNVIIIDDGANENFELLNLTLSNPVNGTLGADPQSSRRLLMELLDQILLLLHPIMPFITEEVWQTLGEQRPSIMIQSYPKPMAEWHDAEAETRIQLLRGDVVGAHG